MKKVIISVLSIIMMIVINSVSVVADVVDDVPNCYSGSYEITSAYAGRMAWYMVDASGNSYRCRLNAPYILLEFQSDVIDQILLFIYDHNYNNVASYDEPTSWYKYGGDNVVYFVLDPAHHNWNYYYSINMITSPGVSGNWAEKIHRTIYIASSERFSLDKAELIEYYIKLGKEQGYAEAGRDWSERLKEVEERSYQIGYNEGLAAKNSQIDALGKIFPSVFGSIFGFLNDIFSIQFWGTSIWEIILALSSISIMIVVLRLFLK